MNENSNNELLLVIEDKHYINSDNYSNQTKGQNNDEDTFRKLANDIMDNFSDFNCDDYDYFDQEPTFTNSNSNKDITEPIYDVEIIPEIDKNIHITDCYNDQQTEPWNYLHQCLMSNNQRFIKLLTTINITPNSESLTDFYYANYSDSGTNSDLFKHWKLLDSLNTLMSDSLFCNECLTREIIM